MDFKKENLYFKGEWDETLFSKCVAVVGSRHVTSYGERVVEKIIPGLVNVGVTIVSGFMYGVDQAAHKTALECGGKTIAVLGWGIDWQVPEDDMPLYGLIEKDGLILSEYKGDQKPQLWMFPQRNRIVADISQAILIIEAGEGSGSLITANWALKYGRKLFAVPGPITSSVSVGTNTLIKTGKAAMTTSADDILRAMGWENTSGRRPEVMSTSGILEILGREGLSVDDLSRMLKKTVTEISIELSNLQLQGKVEENGGKFFLKVVH